jgi:thioesterase domain-containing protein/acyl carrier protein
MLTSGSTGNSKAVELTHRNILASMIAKRNRHHWSSADVAFNWVGFDHVAALLEAHTTAASVGAMQVHIEPAKVLADPLLFLRIIDRYRVSVTFAPNFLLGQINSALQSTDVALHTRNGAPPDLSCLRRILTGGEANVVQTGLRFLELLKPYGLSRDALCPIYGLTETCAAVVYSLEFPMLDANREFATVGLPVDGLEMRITDEDGHSLPDRESGEVQVRGPIVFSRYYKNEEATQAAFTADGWFRTGDLGRIDDERLSIVARIKDTIIVSGVNYFSHELETQLQQLDGIERSFLAAFPIRPKGADTEQLVVAFATPVPATVEERIYQLLVAVRNTAIMLWGFRPTFVLPLPMSAFPKTSLGKIQRSLMRKRFEAGTYNAELASVADITARQLGGHTAPKSQTESGVAEIYAAILGIGPSALSTTASFFDLGGTSLDILKLTHALEIRFGVKASLPIIVQNPTVCQLAARILSGSPIAGATYDPVVPLQTTGRKTPLFCVHPGNSEVLVLVNLAKYFLNDRPFYAFRPPGFNTGEACFERLEDFVNSYANAVIERQPQGPYAIAGYSMGAGIAFEIAKELETRGHTVGFLGLIDYVPNFVPISVQFVEIATAVAWVLELIDAKQCERLRAEIPDAPATLETSEYILRFASRTRVAQLDLDSTKFLTWSRVAHVTEDVMYQHATIGKVSSMTIFCSDGIAGLALGDDWRKRLRRWGEFSLQPAKFVDVPGDHYTLMMPKNVASFQALFRAEIETALHKHEVS